jgi:hypothetical protein
MKHLAAAAADGSLLAEPIVVSIHPCAKRVRISARIKNKGER